jgi:integrase
MTDDRALVPLPTEFAPDVASTRTTALTLDQVIEVWLAAKAHGKTDSRTYRVYRDTLTSLRATLRLAGLDLDTPDLTTLETAVQGWARQQRQRDKQGNVLSTPVAGTTFNHRLNVVSSFYGFARRRHFLNTLNPVDALDRDRVQVYAHAQAIDHDDITDCLEAIDRATLIGLRDYALLQVALNTGRRLAELAGMRAGHLAFHGAHKVTITFPAAKGDKIMYNDLARIPSDALLDWLRGYYGAALTSLPADAPVWVTLVSTSRYGNVYGQPLSVRGLGYVYERRLKRLGVTKVHATRHTYAHEMLAVGASVREIQEQLGHSNSATTERYLGRLTSGHNPHAEALAARFVRHGKGT